MIAPRGRAVCGDHRSVPHDIEPLRLRIEVVRVVGASTGVVMPEMMFTLIAWFTPSVTLKSDPNTARGGPPRLRRIGRAVKSRRAY